ATVGQSSTVSFRFENPAPLFSRILCILVRRLPLMGIVGLWSRPAAAEFRDIRAAAPFARTWTDSRPGAHRNSEIRIPALAAPRWSTAVVRVVLERRRPESRFLVQTHL